MFSYIDLPGKFVVVLLASIALASCVTETTESPSMKFSDAAVIAVQDPNIFVSKGSTFAWLPEAVRFYEDERLANAPVKSLIEKEIIKNMLAKEMVMVESVNGAKYAIAYTAALESSLDDSAIIRRFGLLPGNSQVPQDDSNIEKGTLVIYVFENRSNDVVWRSAAQVSVKFDTSADERQQRVERVLAEMFQTFKVTE
ncbi:MAG: DUF4136 domain-containing protein [Gammaproteobacteria bacterium]|jgi:hypothetical protein|nr:DUF4136 domain-containing protein [Gammaproteobacteria bacterium]